MCRFFALVPAVFIAITSPAAMAQTIEQTYEGIESQHPSVQSARLSINLAEEAMISAQAARSVQISAGVSTQLQSMNTDRPFGGLPGETFLGSAQIEAVLPLYRSGAITAGLDQAKLSIEAAELSLAATLQDLYLQGVNAHLTLYVAQENLQISDQNKTRLQRQFEAANTRLEAGVVTRTDVAFAEARFRAAEAEYAGAEAQLQSARAIYEQVTGIVPDQVALADAGMFEIPFEEGLADVRLSNPRLEFQAVQERIATTNIEISRSALGPSVDAFGSASIQDGSWDNQFRDETAVLGARVNVPLYTGGRTNSSIRQAITRREQVRLSTENLRNQLTADYASAWANHLAALSARTAAHQEIAAAEFALNGAETELRAGLRTTLEVLDQEQALLNAQLRLLEAEKNVYLTQSQILALMGRLGAAL